MNKLEFFKDKQILITGHTGFKGSWLCEILLALGANVIGYSLETNTSPNLFSILELDKRTNNYISDIRDYKTLLEIMKKEKPEIVIHMAAQPLVRESYNEPIYTYETNVIGTVNVLQAIKETNCVRSAVMITTDKVYENKERNEPYTEDDELGGYDPYSTSKACAELIIRSYTRSFFNPNQYQDSHNTLVASARAGNVIGGGDWSKDRLVPDIVKAVFENNEKVIVRNPDSIRPWQYVLEPSYGYMLLAKKLYEGKKEFSGAWNFGPNNENYLTVKELLEKALKILKKGSYTIKKDYTKHESKLLRLDISKAKNVLGWRPSFDIDTTLNLTFDWYKSFYSKEDIVNLANQQIESFFNRV